MIEALITLVALLFAAFFVGEMLHKRGANPTEYCATGFLFLIGIVGIGTVLSVPTTMLTTVVVGAIVTTERKKLEHFIG